MMNKKLKLATGLLVGCLSSTPTLASERFIGEVFFPGGNFCPRGSIPVDGSSLSTIDSASLFDVIGATYGGNGRTTFSIPNMAGRALLGQGRTLAGEIYQLGQASDITSYGVTGDDCPSHSHSIYEPIKLGDASVTADHHSPHGESLGLAPQKSYSQQASACASNMADDVVQLSGKANKSPAPSSSISISTTNPYVAMLACIAYKGAMPQRGGQ